MEKEANIGKISDADLSAELARREAARREAEFAEKRAPLQPLKPAFVDDKQIKMSDLVSLLQSQRTTMADDLWPHANCVLIGLQALRPVLCSIFTDEPVITLAPGAAGQ